MEVEDPIEMLSRVSGVKKSAIKRIFEQVKQNQAKLKGCKRHRFGIIAHVGRSLDTHECLECGGSMKFHDIYVYSLGYKANGGNPDDIYTLK